MGNRITWHQPHRYYLGSEQGYTVSKTFLQGEPGYTAWPPKPPRNEQHRFLGIRDNLADAQALCEEHYKTQGARR